jgi:hypothetical protein
VDRDLAGREKVLPHRPCAKAARADSHVQTTPVRDDDLGDTVNICARASSPEADGSATHAKVEVAVDDGHDETSWTHDLRRRRLAPNRRDPRATKLALRSVGSATGGGQPDEEQCEP